MQVLEPLVQVNSRPLVHTPRPLVHIPRPLVHNLKALLVHNLRALLVHKKVLVQVENLKALLVFNPRPLVHINSSGRLEHYTGTFYIHGIYFLFHQYRCTSHTK